MIRKIITSYALSLPVLILGIVFLIQASDPVSADAATTVINGTGRAILTVVGFILIFLAISSIILRYVSKKER